MKKMTLTFVIILATITLVAQTQQALKYQAVARDNSGNVLANQNVSFQISILQGTASGNSVYTEAQNVITTEVGLVNMEIGNGIIVSGDYSTIKWGYDLYFLKVEMDETGGTNYQIMGTSQLLSVPYSLNSRSLTLISPNGTNYDVTVDDSGVLSTITAITCPPNVTDIDGNTYDVVKIDAQCWMAENLKTTKYRNGDNIEYPGSNNTAWASNTTGAYAWYDNDISWKNLYGALYNWHAVVNTEGLCPTGWHVPSQNEREILTDFIGGISSPNSKILKSCRQDNSPLGGDCNTIEHPRWDENSSYYGTDNYGFAGLPNGFRFPDGASFGQIGQASVWWTSSVFNELAQGWRMNHNSGNITGLDDNKGFGVGVRCLRD